MPRYRLTDAERCLGISSFIVILTSIVLALCISLVLPKQWRFGNSNSRRSGNTDEESDQYCNCHSTMYTTNILDCIPHVLAKRILPKQSDIVTSACNSITNYPYLVSLNAPAYGDEKQERRFVCSGTILSEIWVLVGADCVHNSEKWSELKLRAGSHYWSKEGTEYSLISASQFSENGPVAVKVDPPFVFDTLISAVKIPKSKIYPKWSAAVSPGWRSKNKKFNIFFVERWSTTPCLDKHCNTAQIKAEAPCVEEADGRAMVTTRKYLIGFRTGVCYISGNRINSIFADLQTDDYRSWFQFLLGNSEEKDGNYTLSKRESNLKVYETTECVLPDFSEDDLVVESFTKRKRSTPTSIAENIVTTKSTIKNGIEIYTALQTIFPPEPIFRFRSVTTPQSFKKNMSIQVF